MGTLRHGSARAITIFGRPQNHLDIEAGGGGGGGGPRAGGGGRGGGEWVAACNHMFSGTKGH